MGEEDMLGVKIRFFSTLKNVTNQNEVNLEVEKDKTLLSLLQHIQSQYFIPNKARILNASENALDTGIICLINDADISLTGGINQKINKDGKVITLISSLHGG